MMAMCAVCSAWPEWNSWPQRCCLRLYVSQLLMSCASLKPVLVSLTISASRNSGSVFTLLPFYKYGIIFIRLVLCLMWPLIWNQPLSINSLSMVSSYRKYKTSNEMHKNQLHSWFAITSSHAAVCLSISSNARTQWNDYRLNSMLYLHWIQWHQIFTSLYKLYYPTVIFWLMIIWESSHHFWAKTAIEDEPTLVSGWVTAVTFTLLNIDSLISLRWGTVKSILWICSQPSLSFK